MYLPRLAKLAAVLAPAGIMFGVFVFVSSKPVITPVKSVTDDRTTRRTSEQQDEAELESPEPLADLGSRKGLGNRSPGSVAQQPSCRACSMRSWLR